MVHFVIIKISSKVRNNACVSKIFQQFHVVGFVQSDSSIFMVVFFHFKRKGKKHKKKLLNLETTER